MGGFSTRRGRPVSNMAGVPDMGTPELRAKRSYGLTSEAIDLCLERGIITADQHWCGIHFRWLHSLRFGVADAKTSYRIYFGERTAGLRTDEWTDEREHEYLAAIAILKSSSSLIPVMKLCVYNEKPGFLYLPFTTKQRRWKYIPARMEQEINSLRHGLGDLADAWINNNDNSDNNCKQAQSGNNSTQS